MNESEKDADGEPTFVLDVKLYERAETLPPEFDLTIEYAKTPEAPVGYDDKLGVLKTDVHFKVDSAVTRLAPTDILQLSPPQGSITDSNRLPAIILRDWTLPWARPGDPLVVLLFEQSEIVPMQSPQPALWISSSALQAQVTTLTADANSGGQKLCHVRVVSASSDFGKIDEDNRISLVVGCRLTQPSKRYTALVTWLSALSIPPSDAQASAFDSSAPARVTGAALAAARSARPNVVAAPAETIMVFPGFLDNWFVLKLDQIVFSWRFETSKYPEDFQGLAESMAFRKEGYLLQKKPAGDTEAILSVPLGANRGLALPEGTALFSQEAIPFVRASSKVQSALRAMSDPAVVGVKSLPLIRVAKGISTIFREAPDKQHSSHDRNGYRLIQVEGTVGASGNVVRGPLVPEHRGTRLQLFQGTPKTLAAGLQDNLPRPAPRARADGTLDWSLVVAWELGRLLALSSLDTLQSLLRDELPTPVKFVSLPEPPLLSAQPEPGSIQERNPLVSQVIPIIEATAAAKGLGGTAGVSTARPNVRDAMNRDDTAPVASDDVDHARRRLLARIVASED